MGKCAPLLVQNTFIFMDFSGTKLQNNKLLHPTPELVSPLWEILDSTLVS